MTNFSQKRTWGPDPIYPKVCGFVAPNSESLISIAGPCSIEGHEQMDRIIPVLQSTKTTYARGGVYRAGTYPRQDGVFGLQERLLHEWHRRCSLAGLKTIVEILDIRQIEAIDAYADAFQVGARHTQDYALLKELSRTKKTVTLKRAVGATLDEFLGAAEYLLHGPCRPTLIERGSATHMNHVRWDLSISLIAAVKRITGVPVLVDASHGTGRRDLVFPMTMAGVAAGADGFLVEVHPEPEKSLSDADQAYPLDAYPDLLWRAGLVKKLVGLKPEGEK